MIYYYIRRSRQTQELSVERQENIISEWAQKNNTKPDRVFIEQPISGASKLKERPALSELMTLLQKGDKLVCADPTRLARNSLVFNMILGLVHNAEAELVFADGTRCDGDDLVSMLMTSILAWTAQWEREQISSRTKQALAVVKQTKALGRPDRCEYGYTNQHGHKVPVADEQAIGNLVLDLRSKGQTYRSIQTVLAARGMMTRVGTEFSVPGLSQLARKFRPAS